MHDFLVPMLHWWTVTSGSGLLLYMGDVGLTDTQLRRMANQEKSHVCEY